MDLKSEIYNFYCSKKFPDFSFLLELLDRALSLLECEDVRYRPKEKEGEKLSGGLLDFCRDRSFSGEVKPVIVVPDLHARGYFLWNVLNFEIEVEIQDEAEKNVGKSAGKNAEKNVGKSVGEKNAAGGKPFDCKKNLKKMTVLDACMENRIRLVCVGDIFHSELRCHERWKKSFEQYRCGIIQSEAMKQEMLENLNLLQMVLALKLACPESFHCLKGNHENLLNEEGRGNHPFCKMAAEGEMFYSFMADRYDDAIIYLFSCLEHSLPLCAVFPNLVVSHAEPAFALTKSKIINYRKFPEVTLALTWTANGEAKEGSVPETMKNLLGKGAEDAVWIGGHRPVKGRYELRQDGRYVQIHNPSAQQVALVWPGKRFDPETDIVNVAESEGEGEGENPEGVA